MNCCQPKRFAGPSGVRMRHTCAAKNGQPFVSVGERRTTDRLTEQHRIEDRASDIWELKGDTATLVATANTREHFNICKDPDCQRCEYVVWHLDDEDDPSPTF